MLVLWFSIFNMFLYYLFLFVYIRVCLYNNESWILIRLMNCYAFQLNYFNTFYFFNFSLNFLQFCFIFYFFLFNYLATDDALNMFVCWKVSWTRNAKVCTNKHSGTIAGIGPNTGLSASRNIKIYIIFI